MDRGAAQVPDRGRRGGFWFDRGFKVSTVDVEDLLEGERDVDVSEETLAYQRMTAYIQTLHDVEDFRHGKEFLNAFHWMSQGHRHTPRKPAGKWRRGAVYVTDARDPASWRTRRPTRPMCPR